MNTRKLALAAIIVTAIPTAAVACSNVIWESNHGTVVSRTMDWMAGTQPTLAMVEGKYDVLAVLGYGYVAEGVNAHGLQGSLQYYRSMSLPAFTEAEHDVNQLELLGLLLKNYKTVDEVVNNIDSIKVGSSPMPELPETPAFHYILADKTGDRIVLQYDKAGLNVTRGAAAQVVTNTPQAANNNNWVLQSKSLNEQGGHEWM